MFLVYTSVRRPSEFCNGIESSAFPLPVNEKGNVLYHLIVPQEADDQSDRNDPLESSSDAGKGKTLDIDLNLPLPDED